MNNRVLIALRQLENELLEERKALRAKKDEIDTKLTNVETELWQVKDSIGRIVDAPVELREEGEEAPRAIAYKGEVFRYSLQGEYVSYHTSTEEATQALAKELGIEPKASMRHAIGYCCTNSYNLQNGEASHRKYKGFLFTTKVTPKEELLKELKGNG